VIGTFGRVYRAGFTNPWHSHPCAHGVYVLEGTLSTHQGQYPAGSFVWFPEGGIMEHGATQEEDCTFLFITNKPFDMHFVGDENDRLRRRPSPGRDRRGPSQRPGAKSRPNGLGTRRRTTCQRPPV